MSPKNDFYPSRKALAYKGESNGRQMSQQDKPSYFSLSHFLFSFYFSPVCCSSLHDNKPVYRLPQQSIRRLAFVPPYSVFCSISFRCGWVKYRAQPEAISTWNHAGCNAPWQAETGWGEKVKPRKPAWNQAFLWLSICGCQVRNKNFTKKKKK